jgi:predicted enzyme involved in methoxymalonyl-ACP biosynthesis
MRPKDRFGDNGIIAILISKLNAEGELLVDTWLVRCRVLGRQVGCTADYREFVPTGRNEMVEALYRNLGFLPSEYDN